MFRCHSNNLRSWFHVFFCKFKLEYFFFDMKLGNFKVFCTVFKNCLNASDARKYILDTVTDLNMFFDQWIFWSAFFGCPNQYNRSPKYLATALIHEITPLTLSSYFILIYSHWYCINPHTNVYQDHWSFNILNRVTH